MNTHAKKTKHVKKGGGLVRITLVLALLLTLAAAGISFTERHDWPESLRDHEAVVLAYRTRDDMIRAVWAHKGDKEEGVQQSEKAPINIRPASKKPEQGYSAGDRAKLEALIEKEGDLP